MLLTSRTVKFPVQVPAWVHRRSAGHPDRPHQCGESRRRKLLPEPQKLNPSRRDEANWGGRGGWR
jgi:hypothetical protein